MYKKPGGKKTMGLVVAAPLFVVLALVLAFWSGTMRSQRTAIVLPEPTTAETKPQEETAAEQELFFAVSPENIQDILATMGRPDYYTQILEVKTFWDGGEDLSTVTIWRSGDLFKAKVAGVETRYVLSDGAAVWLWYGGDEEALQLELSQDVALDDLVGLPIYETVAALEPGDILQGEYVPGTGAMPENCLFFTANQSDDRQVGYWVDATSQILVAAEETKDGGLQYAMTQTALDFTEIAQGTFVAPGGVELLGETA